MDKRLSGRARSRTGTLKPGPEKEGRGGEWR